MIKHELIVMEEHQHFSEASRLSRFPPDDYGELLSADRTDLGDSSFSCSQDVERPA